MWKLEWMGRMNEDHPYGMYYKKHLKQPQLETLLLALVRGKCVGPTFCSFHHSPRNGYVAIVVWELPIKGLRSLF